MTDFAIQQQIQAIRNATDRATKSRAAARKFLTDAGIVSKDKPQKKSDKKQG
jgi:hypothetical protein